MVKVSNLSTSYIQPNSIIEADNFIRAQVLLTARQQQVPGEISYYIVAQLT
jgi:hypothetical protein